MCSGFEFVLFSGTHICSGSACHKVVTFWDTETLEKVNTLSTSYGSIHSLATTEKFIIVGTYNQVPLQ